MRIAAIILFLDITNSERPLRQWASEARASSEYSNPDWAARQACGEPDTMQGGDIVTAWASKEQDGGDEWLELGYKRAVRVTQVRVRETYNPGAVSRIEAQDSRGRWIVVWQGKDTTKEAPGWLDVKIQKRVLTRKIRITIDSRSVPGWNEIDAVELIGY
jgi:hypothetical protein